MYLCIAGIISELSIWSKSSLIRKIKLLISVSCSEDSRKFNYVVAFSHKILEYCFQKRWQWKKYLKNTIDYSVLVTKLYRPLISHRVRKEHFISGLLCDNQPFILVLCCTHSCGGYGVYLEILTENKVHCARDEYV